MRKRLTVCLLVLFILLTILPLAAAEGAVQTDNADKQNYSTWSSPVCSYLTACKDGSLMRLEFADGRVIIEYYGAEDRLLSAKSLPMELPLFGGFYEGTNCYFLAFGQENLLEDNEKEVIRVVSYDKKWNRLGAASLYGANTRIPFDAGSLRMAQSGDILYLRTAHEMYRTTDGLCHQANMMLSIRISSMELTDSQTAIWNIEGGYVSHSFNQFLRVDGSELLAVDHGDALPRSVCLIRYTAQAGLDRFFDIGRCCDYVNALPIAGRTGENSTGVSVGGFEVSDSSYLIAGNSVLQDEELGYNHVRNVFVTVTDKNDFSEHGTAVHWITDYPDNASYRGMVSTPHLVKITENRFLLLWTVQGKLQYVFLDGKGKTTSRISSVNVPLSDCEPIVTGDAVCWYCTHFSEPIFYRIDLATGEFTPSPEMKMTVTLYPCMQDLQSTYYTVAYGMKMSFLTAPSCTGYEFAGWYTSADYTPGTRVDETTAYTWLQDMTLYAKWTPHICHFEVQSNKVPDCTHDGFNTYVCAGCGNSYTETIPASGHRWDSGSAAVELIVYTCLHCGATKTEKQVCRGDASCPSHRFTDVPAPDDWAHDGIDFAVSCGLLKGMRDGKFEPSTPMTRGMLVTVLWRYAGQPENGYNRFADVANGMWYTQAISWAADCGVVNGVGNNRFDPNGKITREQMAAILFRYADAEGKLTHSSADLSGFSDAGKVHGWACSAMQWAVAEEVINGMPDGSRQKLDPQGYATRAQAAAILMRYIKD